VQPAANSLLSAMPVPVSMPLSAIMNGAPPFPVTSTFPSPQVPASQLLPQQHPPLPGGFEPVASNLVEGQTVNAINAVRLSRVKLIRWYRHDRKTFNTKLLEGLLVRVEEKGNGYVGEIVGVERAPEPYFLSNLSLMLQKPPSNPAKLESEILSGALVRTTFHLVVEIPGLDEGTHYTADKITNKYFSPHEVSRWLAARQQAGKEEYKVSHYQRIIQSLEERLKAKPSSSHTSNNKRPATNRETSSPILDRKNRKKEQKET